MSERVRLEPLTSRLTVHLGDELVADSTRAFVVHEQGLPPRYYVPREDVKAELKRGEGAGTCPWKGKWHHLDVVLHDKAVARGAWTYGETTPVCEPVRNYVAFYDDKLSVRVS